MSLRIYEALEEGKISFSRKRTMRIIINDIYERIPRQNRITAAVSCSLLVDLSSQCGREFRGDFPEESHVHQETGALPARYRRISRDLRR